MNERPEERHAERLRTRLEAALSGSNASVSMEGAGVHWHVDASRGTRTCRVHCFHYERPEDAQGPSLELGPRGNAHLSTVDLGSWPRSEPREGAEYLVTFLLDGVEQATGRVPDEARASAAVLDWVTGNIEVSELRARHEFVDEWKRKLEGARNVINAGLKTQRAEIGEGEFGELWVYAAERSCRIAPKPSGCAVALLLHRTQLALVELPGLERALRLIARWTEDGASLQALGNEFSLVLSPFAAEFERGDYAAWHWGNVMAQAEHDEVLTRYRPLLERIVSSPSTKRFFSFTSLYFLRFTRCALYPFDVEDLPFVSPTRDGRFTVKTGPFFSDVEVVSVVTGTAEEVWGPLQEILRADSTPTHPGTLDDLLPELLDAAFVARGSSLRARKVQRQQWMDVKLDDGRGRSCGVSLLSRVPVHRVGADALRMEGTVDEVAEALIAWAQRGS